ncbi:MAG TPA: NUDIX hydrolase [Burkholderiales bacterium]|nr:NUDIX hydrolase [Burkholderiales bacterium]
MGSDFTEKKLTSKVAYRGRMLQVNEDQVELPGGGQAGREYVVHPGAALILPLFDDGSVLLERQYRYPAADHFYELPAGKFEPGEPAMETAKRELLEETGYVAAEWRALGKVFPCIGYSDEVIEFFLARKLEYRRAQQLDEGEFLETLRLPLPDALEWVRSGRINDVKTMYGLLLAEKILKENW